MSCDVVGLAEIATMLGVSRQRVYQLRRQPGFPSPHIVLRAGAVWRRDAVQEWMNDRQTTSEGVRHG